MSTLKPNTTLQGGKYKIVRFISAGGFGCTYEGFHVMLKRRVAIKEFFVKDFCNRDEVSSQVTVGITSKTALVSKLKRKFIEEAQSLCSLEHKNIVHVYDVFEENGTAYYVMYYVDGLSLNDMIKERPNLVGYSKGELANNSVITGSLSETEAINYIKQVASALKYVHSQNRLHLDIKPSNIMVDKNGKTVLIDFGASKQYDEEGGENTSALLGKTPGFAPLEQMGNDVATFYPSTDIYALGATLYKLLTGVTPPSATLLASGEKLAALPSSISETTRNLVHQSMQRDKAKRLQNMAEFLQKLSTGGGNDGTIIDDEEDDDPTIIEEPKRSNWKKYASIAVVITALAITAALTPWDYILKTDNPEIEEVQKKKQEPNKVQEPKKEEQKAEANTIKKEDTKTDKKNETRTEVKSKQPTNSITFPFGSYSGADDGEGNGNRGSIRVNSSYTLSTNGGELSLQPGDEIVNTQIRNGKLRSGVWVHDGERTSFVR